MNANKNLEIVLYVALVLSLIIVFTKLPNFYLALPTIIILLSLASDKITNGFVIIMKAFINFIFQIFVKIFIAIFFLIILLPIVFIQGLVHKAKPQSTKDIRIA